MKAFRAVYSAMYALINKRCLKLLDSLKSKCKMRASAQGSPLKIECSLRKD